MSRSGIVFLSPALLFANCTDHPRVRLLLGNVDSIDSTPQPRQDERCRAVPRADRPVVGQSTTGLWNHSDDCREKTENGPA
ncbi:uncharacterized protein PgNI_00071 [Pyricularia grisea]|uniref:Uncharacterized protein n=1 Tax=Pyricularia grisea TaxID=148305 RepID=A0A6P8BGF5_PYRGI|nr:uncharacterized protein PgNI_00071 [Pyricularia grisea]TLD15863.1 hypothetical protein PgNI_00071 [Pyricularia grisea]